jgi:cytochrome c oxidase subunit 2
MSSLASPERVWWKRPLGGKEKFWLVLALIWCMVLTFGMVAWIGAGKQNIPTETYKVEPNEFRQLTTDFINKYKVGEENGVPVVRPPAGSDVYLQAQVWSWSSILELKKDATYRLHVSSVDLQHGFSLQPGNLNYMVLPGYDYVLTLTPDKVGTYDVICNEFCGTGHHTMVGKIKVTE